MAQADNTNVTDEIIAGRYRVVRALGKGGMGAVYEVADRTTGQELALKRLTRSDSEREARLFEREYRTLAGLRHPRIVRVHDYGVDASGAFYTMELLRGGDLTGKAPMPWRTACACLRDAASILGVLHARQLVHRDLSPRNLWQTTDGRLKLIDFGALTHFGYASEIVGTPPLIAPEALAGEPLDQRTDLYSLGALGFWLVTGTHAFRAKRMAELPRLWKREPAQPSSLVALLDPDAPNEFPEALDRLLLSLLKPDPQNRPATTEEVIDSLNAIAGLRRESQAVVTSGYLHSNAFVGREDECERFSTVLERARGGVCQGLIVQGSRGLGRSRLLEEWATRARVAGAVAVRVSARASRAAYGTATQALLQLLEAAPQEAEEAVRPHVALLARVSHELAQRLGVNDGAVRRPNAGEDRLQMQNALLDSVAGVARRRLVVLLFDDLDRADEVSRALVASLTRVDRGERLVVVASCPARGQASEELLDACAPETVRLQLQPLLQHEIQELLQSVFGKARYLERLSARLFERSAGNPSHCLLLTQQLVDSRIVRYVDGAWSLPMDLTEAQLPATLEEGLRQRLSQLSEDALGLARWLSVPHYGPLTEATCLKVSQYAQSATRSALEELVTCDVLRQGPDGFRFVHAVQRSALYAELGSSERRRVHRAFAHLLEETGEEYPGSKLVASLHWLRAGETDRGHTLLRDAGLEHAREPADLREFAPLYEDALEVLREQGAPRHTRLVPLSVLAIAGYYAHRRYAERHGEQAIAELHAALRYDLVERLRRWLGRKLSLFVALVVAGVSMRRKRHAPALEDVVFLQLAASSCLSGCATVCLNPTQSDRYGSIIEPLTALGPDHAATLIYRFNQAVALSIKDYPAQSIRATESFISRLRDPRPIKGLDDRARRNYLAGAVFACGVKKAFRCDDSVLESAAELQQFGELYAMHADHLRVLYHTYRGEMDEADHYRKRVELAAVQLGTTWQAETWGMACVMPASWSRDTITLKGHAEQLARLARELPSLREYETTTRASYLILHGKPGRALELMRSAAMQPLAALGWSHKRGVMANALNALGRHAEAREVCREVFDLKTPEEIDVVGLVAMAQVEMAIADAHLGDVDAARSRIDELIARHTSSETRLLLGYLHETRVRIALLERDFAVAREHLERMSYWLSPTRIRGALDSIDALTLELDRAERPELHDSAVQLVRDDGHLNTRVHVLLESAQGSAIDQSRTALKVAMDVTSAEVGCILFTDPDVASVGVEGQVLEPDVLAWAREELQRNRADEATRIIGEEEELAETRDDVLRAHGRRYICVPVWAQEPTVEELVGCLLLGFERETPRVPPEDVMQMLASHLLRAGTMLSSEQQLVR